MTKRYRNRCMLQHQLCTSPQEPFRQVLCTTAPTQARVTALHLQERWQNLAFGSYGKAPHPASLCLPSHSTEQGEGGQRWLHAGESREQVTHIAQRTNLAFSLSWQQHHNKVWGGDFFFPLTEFMLFSGGRHTHQLVLEPWHIWF